MADTTHTPAPPQTVTLKIDGHTITVPKGENVLEAAKSLDIEISHFCYHAGLSSPAVCRQCLVDVKGSPKLVPSCYTVVAENMEVMTATPKVLEARAQMLEFTLLNHPVDCPICDKSGECMLQNQYHQWDHQHTRTDVGKVHKPKMVDLGPTIVLDQERCILCTRCIRVCDEVAGQSQLTMANRGDREILTTAPGQQLDNPYSLNTVDVCPVGALTSKDFRFTMRAWELYTTPSVCPGCATGCNIEIHHAQGEAWRLVPRINLDVNKHWMCDEGREFYMDIAADDRLVGALLAGDPAPVEGAAAFAAERIAAAHKTGKLGIVFGAQATNEDLFLLSKIASVLGTTNLYVAGHAPVADREDKILRSADMNPNTAGATLFANQAGRANRDHSLVQSMAALDAAITSGKVSALWIVGQDVALSKAAMAKLSQLDVVVQATHENELTDVAKIVLPASAWAEIDGTYTNRQGLVQRLRHAIEPRGGSRAHWELTHLVARKLATVLDDIKSRELLAAIELGGGKENARGLFNKMKSETKEASSSIAAAEWGPPAPLIQLRFAGSRG